MSQEQRKFSDRTVQCINGHDLDESPDLPVDERKPCPVCEKTERSIHVTVGPQKNSGQ
jgi:hypothetical protein